MQEPIVSIRLPVAAPQAELFATPAYLLLKEVLSAHCVYNQVEAMNAELYAQRNKTALELSNIAKVQAARYADCLSILDELEQKPDEWFKIKLEPRV